MRHGWRVSLAAGVAAAAMGAVFCTSEVAASPPRHAVVYYVPAPNSQVQDLVAQRYQVGVTGLDYGSDAQAIKTRNPDFKWFAYNSGTDNYVTATDSENQALNSLASAKGWNVEDAFLHYWDDTRTVLQGDTILVPGWGGGSAVNPADARIPVYYKDLSRRVVNFSTPRGMELNKEVILNMAFGQPFKGTNLYADGVFLDNSAAQIYNTGEIVSGGHVREAPNHPEVASSAFEDWHWNQNLGPFLSALKDTLRSSQDWTPDRQHKLIMINVANVWTDDYVTRDVCDVLSMEFQYNPVRNFGVDMVGEAYRRDKLAADAGITSFQLSLVVTEAPGRAGSYSYSEAMMGSLAWFLATRSDQTLLFLEGTVNPSAAGWDTLTWCPAVDKADQQLGDPTGPPYRLTEGVDPVGNPYVIWARPYQNGLVLVRPRGDWNQDITPQTSVTVTLPNAMGRISSDGLVSLASDQLSLRNGQGAVLLGDPGTGTVLPPPPAPPSNDIVPPDPAAAFGILKTEPEVGATLVPAGSQIRFYLTKPANLTSLLPGILTVNGSASGWMGGGVNLEEGGLRLVFTPAHPFLAGETVTAVLSGALQDTEGAYLDGNGDAVGSGDPSGDAARFTFQIGQLP